MRAVLASLVSLTWLAGLVLLLLALSALLLDRLDFNALMGPGLALGLLAAALALAHALRLTNLAMVGATLLLSLLTAYLVHRVGFGWRLALRVDAFAACALLYAAMTAATGRAFEGNRDEFAAQRHVPPTEPAPPPPPNGGLATVTRPRQRLREIIGMQEFKQRLESAAREVLFPPRAAPRGEAGHGILLHGAPGNGKTLFATALAGELGVKLVTVNVPGIVSRWVNQTTERLMQTCDEALRHAPCVLFFDEFDALAVEREKIGWADSESGRTVTALLQRLDALAGKRVLVVAATNRLEAIDQALRREGRFAIKLEVPPPDLPARVAIFRDAFARRAPAAALEAQLLQARAQRWEGFSAARVRAFAIEAAGLVLAAGATRLDRSLILQAQRLVVGAGGDRLAERVPRLEELVLPPALARSLSALARRMQAGEQLELAGGGLPRGVLFHGPPGTGKTLSAQALARTAKWAFLASTSQDLLADAGRIDALFVRAADLRPCVVLIDEPEDVLMQRELAPWSRAITAKLLSVLDGASGPRHDILVVAATNHPDVLDAGALRGGRFAEKYAFALPGVAEIAQYLRRWQTRSAAALHPPLTPEAIAAQFAPASFADVQAVLTAAVSGMWERGGLQVLPEDLAAARASVLGWRANAANAPAE